MARQAVITLTAALISAAAGGTAFAQGSFFGPLNPFRYERAGFQFMGVSATTGYSTRAFPFGINSVPLLTRETGGAFDYGVTTGAGWTRSRQSGAASVQYSLSYNRVRGLESINSYSLGQGLTMSFTQNLGRKWTWGLSASGTDTHLEQSLFQATSASQLASVPVSFADLSTAVLTGRINNNAALSSALTGSLIASPARGLLYGTRMLAAGVSTNLAYSPNSRLTFSFGASGNRAMPLPDSRTNVQFDYTLARTTGVGLNIGMSYALSSRTFVGVSVSTTRTISNFQDTYVSSGSVSFGRTLSRNLFAQGSVGSGRFSTSRTVVRLPGGVQWTASGGLGYKIYEHTIVGSVGRFFGDSYGIGGGSTLSTSAAWTWRRPARSWGLASSVSQQRIGNSAFGNVRSLQANASFVKTLTQRTSLSISYAYLRSTGLVNIGPVYPDAYKLDIQSVRLGFTWSPDSGLR